MQNVWAFIDTIPLAHVAVVVLALMIIAVVLTAIEIRRSPVSSEWDLIRDADGEILGVVDMGRRREQKRSKGIDGETYRTPRYLRSNQRNPDNRQNDQRGGGENETIR